MQMDRKNLAVWSTVHQKACKALLTNQKKAAVGRMQHSDHSGAEPSVRGTVQAYYRTADHIWKPMGAEFREKLTCSKPVARRIKRYFFHLNHFPN
jgi:hypothetical protein